MASHTTIMILSDIQVEALVATVKFSSDHNIGRVYFWYGSNVLLPVSLRDTGRDDGQKSSFTQIPVYG
jgi:hypothetical protein